jgi:uncharacterized membrane protein YjgN (DUF898 family)
METKMTADSGTRVSLKYSGDGVEMAILMLKNLLLTIVTLGIYRAWAKTNTRRYIWGHVSFQGDRATYVGTGEELFKGWIKLFFLLIVVVVGVRVLAVFIKPLALIIPVFYAVIFGLATYSGLRYRLSRTLYRQIRFGVDKNPDTTKEFLKAYLVGVFLSFITLGIYYPFFKNNVRRYLTNKSRYGSVYFSYDGENYEYAGVYFKGLALTIITLGIYAPWFILATERYRFQHTVFQERRLLLTVNGSDLLVFALVAYFGTILTLGLASPWIINWGIRLFVDNLHFDGAPDLTAVVARASDGNALGDDIVAGYDLDLGF